MLARLSGPRRRLTLGLLAAVVALALVGAVLVVRGLLTDDPAPVDQATPGPVLLVPGYGGSTRGLAVLGAALTAQGREVIVAPLPGDGRGDLSEQAQELAEAAEAAAEDSPAGSVDIVGYSAGGVVARLWVASYGGAELARRVLTLGSPHHGTDLAELAAGAGDEVCPIACQQLAPDSDLLRGLNAGDETPGSASYVSIWTTQDQTVVPPDSAELAGAVSFAVQDVCTDAQVDHSELVRDPLVAAIVAEQLAGAQPVFLDAQDCARLSS